MTEPASKTIATRGFRLHYWDWPDDGPTLVLLHSSSHYGRVWEALARELQPGMRIIAPDQRGHGDTEQPQSGNAPEDYAGDVRALAEAEGLDQLFIGGEALGSRVALVYAALHPERVRGLILVGGPDYSTLYPGTDTQRWTTHAASMRARPRRFGSLDAAREAFRANYPWYPAEAIEHELRFNTRELSGGGVEWKYDPDWVGDGLLHAMDDLRQYAARLSCPVLIARPERSWQMTDERMPDFLARFPGAQVARLAGTSAAMEVEAPAALADVMRSFMSV